MYALPVILLGRLHRYAIDARRKNRTWHYFAWSAVAALIATILFALGTAVVALFVYVKLWWLAGLVAGVLVLPIVGPTLVRHVLVRSARTGSLTTSAGRAVPARTRRRTASSPPPGR